MKFYIHHDVLEKTEKGLRWGVSSLIRRFVTETPESVPHELTDTGWRATAVATPDGRSIHLLWARPGDPAIKYLKGLAKDDVLLRTVANPARLQVESLRPAQLQHEFKAIGPAQVLQHPALGLVRNQHIDEFLQDRSPARLVTGMPGSGVSTLLEQAALESDATDLLYLARTPDLAKRVERLAAATQRAGINALDCSEFFRTLNGTSKRADDPVTETTESSYRAFLDLTSHHPDLQKLLEGADVRAVFVLLSKLLTGLALPVNLGDLPASKLPYVAPTATAGQSALGSSDVVSIAHDVCQLLHEKNLLHLIRRDHCRAFDILAKTHGRPPQQLADVVIIDDAQDLTMAQILAARSAARQSIVLGFQNTAFSDAGWETLVYAALGETKVTRLENGIGRPSPPPIIGGLSAPSRRAPWSAWHLPEVVCLTNLGPEEEAWLLSRAKTDVNAVNIQWADTSTKEDSDIPTVESVRGHHYDWAVVWGADETVANLLAAPTSETPQSERRDRLVIALTRARETTLVVIRDHLTLEPDSDDDEPKYPESPFSPNSRCAFLSVPAEVFLPHLQEPGMTAVARARAAFDQATSLLSTLSTKTPNIPIGRARLSLAHLRLAAWFKPWLEKDSDYVALTRSVHDVEISARLLLASEYEEDLDTMAAEETVRPKNVQDLLTVLHGASSGCVDDIKKIPLLLPKLSRLLQGASLHYISNWASEMENIHRHDTIVAFINASLALQLPDLAPFSDELLDIRAREAQAEGRHEQAYTMWRQVKGKQREATQCLLALRRFAEAANAFEDMADSDSAIEAWRNVPRPEEALRLARQHKPALVHEIEIIARLNQVLTPDYVSKLTQAERDDILRLLRR